MGKVEYVNDLVYFIIFTIGGGGFSGLFCSPASFAFRSCVGSLACLRAPMAFMLNLSLSMRPATWIYSPRQGTISTQLTSNLQNCRCGMIAKRLRKVRVVSIIVRPKLRLRVLILKSLTSWPKHCTQLVPFPRSIMPITTDYSTCSMLLGGYSFQKLSMTSLGSTKESLQKTLSVMDSLLSMSLPRKESIVQNLGVRLSRVSERVYFLEIKAIYFIDYVIYASENGSTSSHGATIETKIQKQSIIQAIIVILIILMISINLQTNIFLCRQAMWCSWVVKLNFGLSSIASFSLLFHLKQRLYLIVICTFLVISEILLFYQRQAYLQQFHKKQVLIMQKLYNWYVLLQISKQKYPELAKLPNNKRKMAKLPKPVTTSLFIYPQKIHTSRSRKGNQKQNVIYYSSCSITFTIQYQATFKQMQVKTAAFLHLQPKSSSIEPSKTPSITYNSYQINLISQYLSFNAQSASEASKIIGKKVEAKTHQNQVSKESTVDQKFTTKSAFHNFQKHLINTLKNNIKLRKIQRIEKSKLRIAYELWQFFTSSAKSTKKNLYTILGDNLINNQELIKATNSEATQLYDLLCRTDEEDFKAGQAYLTSAILKQSRKLLKGRLLKGRRMQRSQDFKSYFQIFIEQLEAGTMLRRIPKFKKKDIIEGGLTATNQ